MSEFKIAVLPGDGIGPDIIQQAIRIIEVIGEKYDHTFVLKEALLGGVAIDSAGVPLPRQTLELCKTCDAVLLGAVGEKMG